MVDRKPSKETIEKLRKANLGKNNPMFGKKLTEETKQKLREKLRGRKHTEEALQKMRGRKRSEEFRRKVSERRRGRKASEETKQKMRNQARPGELNNNWKGDKVTYNPLHGWVRKHLPKPDLCEVCNIKPPCDLANITGIYSRAFENWKYMCRRCHMLSDGRMMNLIQYRNKKSK